MEETPTMTNGVMSAPCWSTVMGRPLHKVRKEVRMLPMMKITAAATT